MNKFFCLAVAGITAVLVSSCRSDAFYADYSTEKLFRDVPPIMLPETGTLTYTVQDETTEAVRKEWVVSFDKDTLTTEWKNTPCGDVKYRYENGKLFMLAPLEEGQPPRDLTAQKPGAVQEMSELHTILTKGPLALAKEVRLDGEEDGCYRIILSPVQNSAAQRLLLLWKHTLRPAKLMLIDGSNAIVYDNKTGSVPEKFFFATGAFVLK